LRLLNFLQEYSSDRIWVFQLILLFLHLAFWAPPINTKSITIGITIVNTFFGSDTQRWLSPVRVALLPESGAELCWDVKYY
jgi:hypothetical protein